jgi:hypothetical protein
MDALEDIPAINKPLLTEKGSARLQKTDIFRKIMWFSYEDENTWHPLPVKRVLEILNKNKNGVKPASLLENASSGPSDTVQLNSDLERIDRKYRSKSSGNKRRKNKKSGKNRSKRSTNNKR